MANRVVFPENGFFRSFREFASRVSADRPTDGTLQFHTGILTELMLKMDNYYSAGDNSRALQSATQGLAILSNCDLRVPETRREKDPNRLTLETLARLLVRWDKSAEWYGKPGSGESITLEITRDLRIIYKVLREHEKVCSLSSTFAYAYQRMGDFRTARDHIERGLTEARSVESRRAILASKAALLTRAERYKEAVLCYHACADIDERYGTSLATEGLVLAHLGFGEARSGDHVGIEKMEHGISLCRQASHPGFELQIQEERIEYYASQQDWDAALGIATEAVMLLDRYPTDFSRARARIGRLADFIKESSDMQTANTSPHATPSSPLDELLDAAGQELRHARRYAALTLIIQALELSTLLACLKNWQAIEQGQGKYDTKTKEKISNLTRMKAQGKLEAPLLPTKNEWLFSAQIYDRQTKVKIDQLIKLRNRLFHGNFESGWVKTYVPLAKLLPDVYDWLCAFVDTQGLREYARTQPEELA